jgi:hypothetical protein
MLMLVFGGDAEFTVTETALEADDVTETPSVTLQVTLYVPAGSLKVKVLLLVPAAVVPTNHW